MQHQSVVLSRDQKTSQWTQQQYCWGGSFIIWLLKWLSQCLWLT